MPSYSAIAAAALALMPMALATPTPASLLSKRKTFSVDQVHKGTIAKIGPLSMAKTYKKFNGEMPSDVAAAAAAAVSGSVQTVPEDAYDSLYLTQVRYLQHFSQRQPLT
jgi:hypothetical protein